MRTVWKYPIHVANQQTLEIPDWMQILHVAQSEIEGMGTMWVLVDPDAPKVKKTFVVTGNGIDVPSGAQYVGTFRTGWGVWHVWEEKGAP